MNRGDMEVECDPTVIKGGDLTCCDDDAETLDPPNNRMQGETLDIKRMWRISNCLALKCSATVSCSNSVTLQSCLVGEP